MTKLILSFCFFGLVVGNWAHATASATENIPGNTAAASADQQCDICHQNEARMIPWPEGAPIKIHENAEATGSQVLKQTAEDTTTEKPKTVPN